MTHRRRHLALVCLAFVAFVSLGLPDGVLGVAWPSVRATFGLPLSRLGVLLACGTAAYLLVSTFSGPLERRLGVGRLLVASTAAAGLGLALFAAAPSWGWLLPAMFLGGLGAGGIDAGLNAFAAERFSPRAMSWLHACYGVGATLGPLLITSVLVMDLSWRVGYAALAVGMAALTCLFAATLGLWRTPQPPEPPPPEPPEAPEAPEAPPSEGQASEVPAPLHAPHLPQDAPAHPAALAPAAPGSPGAPATPARASLLATLRLPLAWVHLGVFLAYGGVEVSAGQLAYSLLTEARGVAPQVAGPVVGGYWAALTVGRVVFGQLAARWRRDTILRIGTLGAPAGVALFGWGGSDAAWFAGLWLLGFALAPIFPMMVSATPQRLGRSHGPNAVGLQMSAASLSIATLPGLGAVLMRTVGPETLIPYLLVLCACVLGLQELAVRLARRGPAVA